MDAYEATRVVFSRIQSLDPDHAAKIMGLLLLQDHGDKEMIRLAFGPESLLHSLILKARLDLGLPLSRHNPPPPLSISSPSWAPPADADDFPPDLNLDMGWDPQLRRSYSAGGGDLGLSSPEGPGFGWKPCLYFARGFCKNGSSCRFLHGLNEDKLDAAIDEQRRRLAAAAAGGGGFPYSPAGSLPMSPSSPMNQRAAAAAAAALMLAGDESRFMGRSRIDRSEFAGMVNPASRQIYLTFPADSTFREEDVSNYFSIYGPVQDVRIPYQQKRMFGFVTFVYPETVKLILAKGNPHFVCDARVLVKPYKEKGKVPDKYRKQGERGDFSGCTTPTGLDSRDPFDLGARIMYNNANSSQEMLLRRKLEEEQQAFELQQAIEMQGRRFMGLQLLDFKNRSPAISSPTTITTAPSNDRSSEESPTEDKSPSFVSSGGEQQQLKAVNAAGDKEESGSPNEDSDFQESGEHNLPDSPFASPTKASSLFAGDPFSAASAFSSVPAHSNGNGNANNLVPSTLDVASFKSCFFQTPRLSSGHGAVGL